MFDRFMLTAPLLAAQLILVPPVEAKETPATPPAASETPAAPTAKAPTDRAPSPGQSAARERQKTCGAEWRGLSETQKAAQGPKWPQFWSSCNKRLKGGDKA